jgi:hypothetical protein
LFPGKIPTASTKPLGLIFEQVTTEAMKMLQSDVLSVKPRSSYICVLLDEATIPIYTFVRRGIEFHRTLDFHVRMNRYRLASFEILEDKCRP